MAILKYFPQFLLKPLLKILYRKNGLVLQDFKRINAYFLYKVEGKYLPSNSLGWFLDYQYFRNAVEQISTFGYKPSTGDTIIDVGAGIGEEIIVFSEMVGVTGVVYAIEANPEVFAVLKAVKELNGLHNVHLFNVAVADKDGPVFLNAGKDSFLSSSIISNTNSGSDGYKVEGIRLDNLIQQQGLQKVDLLKVNIEGAERFLPASLEHQIDAIANFAISCHDFRFHAEGDLFFQTKSLISSFLVSKSFSITSQQSHLDYVNDWVYASKAASG